MKRILSLILAVGLFVGLAGQAAAFDNNDLTMVVYNESDNNVVVNLGDLTTMDFSGTDVLLTTAGTVNLSQFGAGIGWNDLSVGYFGIGTTGSYNAWFATTSETAPGISIPSLSSFQDTAGALYTYFGDSPVFTGLANATSSYDIKMNSASTAPGYYAGLNQDQPHGEAYLTALDTVGYLDMYLYHYSIMTLDTGVDADTPYSGVLRLYADGSSVLNPSAVPIPGSLLLLGSGLLGLFGIRRKKA